MPNSGAKRLSIIMKYVCYSYVTLPPALHLALLLDVIRRGVLSCSFSVTMSLLLVLLYSEKERSSQFQNVGNYLPFNTVLTSHNS
jgi:hypothetical protein